MLLSSAADALAPASGLSCIGRLDESRAEEHTAFAFDTLGYAKKLRDAGIPGDQAEAHAEAARDFVMHELVTRYDLQGVKDDLQGIKGDLQAVKENLETRIETVRRELQTAIDTTRRELEDSIDRLSLRLTIRMGVMLAAGLTILGAVLKMHP